MDYHEHSFVKSACLCLEILDIRFIVSLETTYEQRKTVSWHSPHISSHYFDIIGIQTQDMISHTLAVYNKITCVRNSHSIIKPFYDQNYSKVLKFA